MANLKFGKLPDRTPVKIAITIGADLTQALRGHAALYRSTYGEAESVAELIPFILEASLDNDRDFAKVRKRNCRSWTSKNRRAARSGHAGDTAAPSPTVSSASQLEE